MTHLAHHAYIGHGSTQTLAETVRNLENHFGITISQNHNAHVFSLQYCGVDDVRDVIDRALLRPIENVHGGSGYVLLVADGISSEAQNALLKILEEPPAHVFLFLFFPKHQMILPTVYSRVQHLPEVENASALSTVDPRELLSATIPERLKLIDVITENKDKHQALMLLTALETVLGEQLRVATDAHKLAIAQKIARIQTARKDMVMSGSMMKMILESIVLCM